MTTTKIHTTPAVPLLTSGPELIAMLATTRHTPVREMTEMLTRRFGPGLQVRQERGRTTWYLPARKKGAL